MVPDLQSTTFFPANRPRHNRGRYHRISTASQPQTQSTRPKSYYITPIEFAFKARTHKKEVRNLQAEISELRSKLAEADQTIEQYVVDHATARQEIGSKSVEVQNLQTEVLELRSELATAREAARAKVIEVHTPNQTKVSELQSELREARMEAASYAVEVHENEYEILELRLELATARKETESKSMEVQTPNSLQTEVSELRFELAIARKKANSQSMEMQSLISELQLELAAVRKEKTRVSELRSMLTEEFWGACEEDESRSKEVQSHWDEVEELQDLLAKSNKLYEAFLFSHKRDLFHLRELLQSAMKKIHFRPVDGAIDTHQMRALTHLQDTQTSSSATKESTKETVRSIISEGPRTDDSDDHCLEDPNGDFKKHYKEKHQKAIDSLARAFASYGQDLMQGHTETLSKIADATFERFEEIKHFESDLRWECSDQEVFIERVRLFTQREGPTVFHTLIENQ